MAAPDRPVMDAWIARAIRRTGLTGRNDRAIWLASALMGLLAAAIGAAWTGGLNPLVVALAISVGGSFARNSFRVGRPDWKGEFMPWVGWADAWRRCLARLRARRFH